MKRLLCLLLALSLLSSNLPMMVLAEEIPGEGAAETIPVETTVETAPVETTIETTAETLLAETTVEETVAEAPETTAPAVVERELPVVGDLAQELPVAVTSGYSFATFSRDANGNPTLKPGNYARWIDRVELDAYAISLYDWMVENSDNDGTNDALIDTTTGTYFESYDEYGNVAVSGYGYEFTTIAGTIQLDLPYDVDDDTFTNAFYEAAFAAMDKNLEDVFPCVEAVFNAFDRDHPEVFWLMGGSIVRTSFGYYDPVYTGSAWEFEYEQTFQIDLQTTDGDVRTNVYQSVADIQYGINWRDKSVDAILAEIPANTDAAGKVAFFNDWLTKNNCYNTSDDLYDIAPACRECVSALVGCTGTAGPVCEGYARAFKVLCDASNIACVLVDGQANDGGEIEAHMWNYVNILGDWYGVDVTWNDPVIDGVSTAVSGYEREDYLLVGASTMVEGMSFAESHPVANTVSDGGVAFVNGPELSKTAYCVHSFTAPVFRFENEIFYADFTCTKCETTETVPGVITDKQVNAATANKDGSIVYTVAFAGPDGKEYTHTHTEVIPATGEQEGFIDNGTLGENLTWTLDKDGKLTISGTGFMHQCELETQVPWAAYRDQILTVVIEEGITSVGNYAFYDCWKLEEVSLPNSMEGIYPNAFNGCKSLKSVTLSDNVVLVGNSAFYLCESMESLDLGEGVAHIGESAFDMCRALTEITIPASVSTIDAYAFRSCEGLKTVTFEGRWPVISSSAFNGDTFNAYYPADEDTWTADKLTNYGGRITWHAVSGGGEVVPQNPSGKCGNSLTWTLDLTTGVLTISGSGAMDDKDSSIYKPWYEYQEQITKVVIENGVHTIGKNMFALMPNLTEVQLPESLWLIKAAAFEMSEKLKAIDLTYVERVESAAFHGCTGLTEVTIPDGIILEGSDNRGVFTGCTGIKKVTVGNFTNGYYLFSGCTALTDVTLQEGMEALGGHMFDGCTALETVNIPAGADIGGGAFANCTALTNVTFTREIGTVGEHAFKGCTGLTSFTFPQVEALSGSIFFLCDNLSTIKFKGSSPTFDQHTLNNIKVTIYYPSGDSSWNDKINGHFGANIDTWVPYDVSHTFEGTVTAPTCVDQGYTTYFCTDCGYTYQGNPVAASGVHTYLHSADTTCEVCGFIREVVEDIATFSVSGDLTMNAPSQEEIAAKYNTVTTPTTIFVEQPSVTAPYATGKLSDSLLANGLTLLNYFRYTAKLPQVQMTDELNDKAQHGAVLLAAVDQLTHYPAQPADMDDAFYEIGAASTSSSNISYNWGYPAESSIRVGLMGCLHDADNSNIDRLGHRRWLLNPTLLNVGFGYAQSTSRSNYSTTQVFDRSGPAVNYDFISFPASGNFPTNLFDASVPWSVTLNPQRFETPNLNQITVTVTRQSDGTAWTLDSTTGAPTASGQAYLGLDTQWYGIPNCIIFSPGANNLGSCTGTFTVEIRGLKTYNGDDARLLYEVNFFDTDNVNAPHVCVYTEVVTKPTCTEKGYTTYTCACGNTYTGNEVPATGHSYGDWTEAKAPTCTEKGEERRDCANCDAFETREAAAKGHSHTSVVTKPTCTEKGYTTYTCACGDTNTDNEVPATGHSYGNWTEAKAPTCTDAGEERRSCANCDAVETREVAAKGHSYGDWSETKDSTCTEKGEERRDCTNCDHYETRELELKRHVYDTVVTPPTCGKQGYTTYTCTCGDTFVDNYVEATGKHTYSNNVCAVCGRLLQQDIPFTAEEWEVLKLTNQERVKEGLNPLTGFAKLQDAVQVRANETGSSLSHTRPDGSSWYTVLDQYGIKKHQESGENLCIAGTAAGAVGAWMHSSGHRQNIMRDNQHMGAARNGDYWVQIFTCGGSYTSLEVPVPQGYGVDPGTTIDEMNLAAVLNSTTNGTCYLPVEGSYCTGYDPNTCGDQKVTISVLGKSATFTIHVHFWLGSDCAASKTCFLCGQTVSGADGHTLGDWKVHTAPTCTDAGEERKTCANCAYYESREIPALGHTEAADNAVAPTCTEPGLTAGTHCSVCRTILTAQEEIPATGHTEVIDAKVDPTCTESGLTEGKHCSVCKAVLIAQESIPATGHSYGEPVFRWAADNTTCTATFTCPCGDTQTQTCEVTSTTDPTTGKVTYTAVITFGGKQHSAEITPEKEEEILWGDVNGDKNVNYRDAVLILRYAGDRISADKLNLTAADVNGDTNINYRDAVLVLRFAGDRIDKFPVQK